MPSQILGRLLASVVVCVCAGAGEAAAQSPSASPGGSPANATVPSGPPIPIAPESISRDEEGRATVRATRLTVPLHIDGQLDEAIYNSVLPASGFIQMEPNGGAAATERTEMWVLFDGDNVYIAFRVWESAPDRAIVNEMRRDSSNIRQGDSVEFAFDTFRDRRNAILFEMNALGGRTDAQSANERQYNPDWNPIWQLASGKFEGGWTIEAALPFKSIRYGPGTVQDWGIQARRTTKWKNEISYLTRVPPSLGLGRGDFSASLYANLVGIEAPPLSRTLELKPYAIANLTTDNTTTPRRADDVTGDVGVDAKYTITQNLTADLTYNTDFAQVEADEQQVNLTRFSLFFPEKRDFFLENQGLFSFGNTQNAMASTTSDVPTMFYSRRIGLVNNRDVPILGGGRVTGRIGRYSLGFVNMQTREEQAALAPATNFSVVRVKRDVLRRSSVGILMTSRSKSQILTGSNQVYGADGTFAFFSNLSFTTYFAKSHSDGIDAHDTSYRGQMEYAGDRYGVQLERLAIDRGFNPEVGFVRRPDIRKNYGLLRFSPRPASIKAVRKFSWVGQFTSIEDNEGQLTSQIGDGEFAIEFQNSDRFSVGISDNTEVLQRAANIGGPRIPAGHYEFLVVRAGYNLGQQRPVSSNVLIERGGFYGGDRTSISWTRSRVNVSARLAVEPTLVINWFDVPGQQMTTKLAGGRVTYTMTPLLFASTLIQYNSLSHAVSTNARLRWEYRPGSELFVVFNDEHNGDASVAVPGLQNRAFIVKVNRFLRF